MIELDLEVLWLPEELIPQQEAGMEVPIKDCTTRIHTFYLIAAIRPHDEKGYCDVFSNGETYTVKESYESVKQKIRNQMNFKWN
ncbi:hypothetical protein [Flavobacterium caseinilyticum]|uniref:Uncharacterized protein n=1 Tax=Flavobacterium caseinilyticum TaxID=2541732 RepID=A0A4R5AYE4_9FLAO|nr:hypothetical protein [Flavobacterium caseinilyticum]TDD77149.1 hypothetical protein E0F89_05995 [Flavobacterium caseinilyticum]